MPEPIAKDYSSRRLPAELAALAEFQEFVRAGLAAQGCSAEKLFKIQLALEEILVNIISYAYPAGGGWIELRLRLNDQGWLWLDIRDGGIAFNPCAQAPAAMSGPLEQRPIGGLGIFLARQMADQVAYRRGTDINELTLGFRLQDAAGKP